jgi:hypothetical protein
MTDAPKPPTRRRRSSTPWTEVLAMTSMQLGDAATVSVENAVDDEPAFDPETPRDMSSCVLLLAPLITGTPRPSPEPTST